MSSQFQQLLTDAQLHRAVEAQGLFEATEVQQQVIPAAISGKDLQVCAATGSGKTLAFLLPIYQRLLSEKASKSGTRCLILVPTRELARQVLKQATLLSKFCPIKAEVISGGAEFKYQRAMLRNDPEVVIATPGRLVEHMDKGSTELDKLEVLVLDEADRMLDMGFEEDVTRIIGGCGTGHQTLLFSATLKHHHISRLAGDILDQHQEITIEEGLEAIPDIRQQMVLADDAKHKELLLAWLLSHEDFTKALVFTNTKALANKLKGLLEYHNQQVGVLHGDMEQDDRNRVMDRLRRNQINVLVATDIAARGLDVKGIDLVINVDMARNADDYTHRIGRTGRAGESGTAITLIVSYEWDLMARVKRHLNADVELRTIKELEGSFKGPKKIKTSGKAASGKKRSVEKEVASKKPKVRARDTKNVGKRRKPSNPDINLGDGFAPPSLKKSKLAPDASE